MYANEARPVHRFCLPALGPPPHPSIQHTPTTGPAMVLWRCLLSPQCQRSRRTPTLLRHTTTTVVMARIQKQQIQPAAASQGTISCLCLKIPACRFPCCWRSTRVWQKWQIPLLHLQPRPCRKHCGLHPSAHMVLLTWFTCNCISCPACLGKYAPILTDYYIIVRCYYHHHVSL